jgi:hypothetical protein
MTVGDGGADTRNPAEMEAARGSATAYEYLCHLEEARLYVDLYSTPLRGFVSNFHSSFLQLTTSIDLPLTTW